LLKQIREATTNTFGISFASLMRFISDHLLTRGERDLQAVLTTYHNGQAFGIDGTPPARANLAGASHHPDPTVAENKDPFEATLALLAQTAEEALERAGMLGELSRLLAQLQQSTNWVRDAWFVVDPNGICFYMNGAAELLCDLHMQRHNSPIYSSLLLGHAQARDTAISITSIFEKLYPRIHNLDEVQSYLQDFTQGCMYRQELRCRIALETADSTSVQAQQSYTPLPANAHATDYHYQFIRYPLYNRQGQLEANALQVRDVTQQALNEHNVSTLLSSVSHDLRTPLTTIKAAVTSLLQEDIAWSEQDRHAMLEDIDSETDHLTVLVHSLIELSRIEMGALSLAREWCDVVEVWYGAWHKLERLAAGRTVHLQAQARLPLIYGDHALLERVFYNLIENALRRSPGNTSITVFIDSIDKEAQLRVRIIDQGKMIPDNVREKLFVSFQNLRTYGNGLGLAICKGIIHAHQGHIWAELSPDNSAEGACFVFTLPTYKYTIEERTKENAHTLSGEVSPVDPVMGGQVR
ncbi:MAG: hypothetical protein J2P36_24985, partial [Ktedonobacteraceae bacterium]|nr:hypothetical protein [Ktedonobacteraceae bacterium]